MQEKVSVTIHLLYDVIVSFLHSPQFKMASQASLNIVLLFLTLCL